MGDAIPTGTRGAARLAPAACGLVRHHLPRRRLHHRRQFARAERRRPALIADRAIERRSLASAPAQSSGSAPPSPRAETPGRAAVPAAREMLSFISVPPRSLAPAFRHSAAPSGPIFTQDVWMLVISGCSASRATACISTASRKVGPWRAMPAQVHRRFHVHERQRHEFGEAAGLCLQVAQRQQMPRPGDRPLDMAVHDGGRSCAAPADARPRSTSSHCAVLTLSGQMIARTSSSRISAAVPGSVPKPASFSSARNAGPAAPSVAAPCVDLQRREGVHVHPGHRLP